MLHAKQPAMKWLMLFYSILQLLSNPLWTATSHSLLLFATLFVFHGAYVCPTLTAQCEAKTQLLSNIVGYTDTWHKNQYNKCSHSLSLIQILEINDLLFCLSHLMLYDLVFTILDLFFSLFLDFLKYLIIFIFSLQSQRLSTSYCETLEP